jgi:hypothetical protein
MSSVRQTAFKLVVAGGIAVASGLLALYKFSIEPVVLEDADGLGLVPGSSSMAGGSMSSSGSTTPDLSSLKRSLSPSPQVGMSRLGSFSTLATLAEEDEEDYEGASPVKTLHFSASAAVSIAASAEHHEPVSLANAPNAPDEEEELDWGDEDDSFQQPGQTTSADNAHISAAASPAESGQVKIEIPSGRSPFLRRHRCCLTLVHQICMRSCRVPRQTCIRSMLLSPGLSPSAPFHSLCILIACSCLSLLQFTSVVDSLSPRSSLSPPTARHQQLAQCASVTSSGIAIVPVKLGQAKRQIQRSL